MSQVGIIKVHKVRLRTTVILVLLFGSYVVGDLASTIWLIDNHPEGIKGESNPLGVLIYDEQGVLGLIISKIILFLGISFSVIITESYFKREKWMSLIRNSTIIGLLVWSLIVVSINTSLIYSILSLNP